MKSFSAVLCASALATSMITAAWPNVADACGCLSPPDPVALGDDDFAVNQQAEQIMFEVGDDTITAHVLIRYAGEPESFAWIVPVPNAPELALSEQTTFALVDQGTAVTSFEQFEPLCPVQEYRCRTHPFPSCGGGDDGDASAGAGTGGFGDEGESGDGDGNGGSDPGAPPPGVDVIDMQMVGSYETVTFAADEPEAAVTWLQDNGFIVNDTMTPFMHVDDVDPGRWCTGVAAAVAVSVPALALVS
ncbi:MAG: DUF2330 domain-containing protein, partial [Myxococcota bacterium]